MAASSKMSNVSYQFAGAAARIRRNGASLRSGRRSALLGVLTAAYANASRGQGPNAEAANPNPNVNSRDAVAADRNRA